MTFLCAGIAAAGYHHVKYFEGVDAREKYDDSDFYEQVLRVKNIMIEKS